MTPAYVASLSDEPLPKFAGALRIGILVPSSNTALEPELYSLGSQLEGVTLHFSRVPVTRITLESSASAQFRSEAMISAGELLCDAGVDVVVWGGTAGSWLGLEHDYRLVDKLQKSLDVPATTTTLALLEACRSFGITRVSLVTPYISAVNAEITACYESAGIAVVSEAHLGLTFNRAFGEVGPAEIIRLIERAHTIDTEAVLVVCTNLRATSLVPGLENSLSLPVFDSIGVTLLGAMRSLRAPMHLVNAGIVMAQGGLRADLQLLSEHLLVGTGADRVTVRIDLAQFDICVDLPVAEAVLPGVKRIGQDSSIDQRSLSTVQWLEKFRSSLIQDSFEAEPRPPAALQNIYGVKAQMLAPLALAGTLVGWVSVHSLAERRWSVADQLALETAATQALSHIVRIA